jgi:hypothetical protein
VQEYLKDQINVYEEAKDTFMYLLPCKNKLNLWKAQPSNDGIYVYVM